MMGLVGEVYLHRQLLRRLLVIEIEVDVVHLGVEIRELKRMVDRGQLVQPVVGLLQRKLVIEADGVVASGQKEVDVEEKRLQKQSDGNEGKRAFDEVAHGASMREHEARVRIGDVVANGRHPHPRRSGAHSAALRRQGAPKRSCSSLARPFSRASCTRLRDREMLSASKLLVGIGEPVRLQAEGPLDVLVHHVRIAVAVDGDQKLASAIVIDERSRGLLVHIEAVAHRGLVVIVALVHLATALRARLIGGRTDVVAVTAHAARGEALDDHLGVHVHEQRRVERTTQLGQLRIERDRLSGRAREAVKDEALLGVRILQTLGHQADDDVVRHKIAGIHVGLRLLAQLGARLHRRAQHVARRNVRRPELLHQLGGLRALAGARRSQQHDIHEWFPFDLPSMRRIVSKHVISRTLFRKTPSKAQRPARPSGERMESVERRRWSAPPLP